MSVPEPESAALVAHASECELACQDAMRHVAGCPLLPEYHLTVLVGGKVVDFHKPLADPFHRTTVMVGWRDLLRGLLRRRLAVEVSVSADRRTEESVLALHPDHLGYADSPSRKAWNASLNAALRGEDGCGDCTPEGNHPCRAGCRDAQRGASNPASAAAAPSTVRDIPDGI